VDSHWTGIGIVMAASILFTTTTAAAAVETRNTYLTTVVSCFCLPQRTRRTVLTQGLLHDLPEKTVVFAAYHSLVIVVQIAVGTLYLR